MALDCIYPCISGNNCSRNKYKCIETVIWLTICKLTFDHQGITLLFVDTVGPKPPKPPKPTHSMVIHCDLEMCPSGIIAVVDILIFRHRSRMSYVVTLPDRVQPHMSVHGFWATVIPGFALMASSFSITHVSRYAGILWQVTCPVLH